jgi:2-C-methyl-D-erythritol 4-phosphate cytidylyltransferase
MNVLNENNTAAIIVAAGNSRRMGHDKIFSDIGGKPLIARVIDTCQQSSEISEIILVFNSNNINAGKELCSRMNWTKVTDVCTGGDRRQDSVQQGLNRITQCEWVLIQDGARPFITTEMITRGIKAAAETGAAIAAVPVNDTIKQADNNQIVVQTLERNSLWAIQTPQIYRFDIISEAYKNIKDDVTDDAAMVEKLGYKVKIFLGSYNNIKITTQEDMIMAEIIAGGSNKS